VELIFVAMVKMSSSVNSTVYMARKSSTSLMIGSAVLFADPRWNAEKSRAPVTFETGRSEFLMSQSFEYSSLRATYMIRYLRNSTQTKLAEYTLFRGKRACKPHATSQKQRRVLFTNIDTLCVMVTYHLLQNQHHQSVE
jgi:hypothetical protein